MLTALSRSRDLGWVKPTTRVKVGAWDTGVYWGSVTRALRGVLRHGDCVNVNALEFTLVRWLSPHPDTLLRDSKLRPICKPPMDINHALWTYATRPADRDLNTANIQFYDGNTENERKTCFRSEIQAYFDLIQPDSFVTLLMIIS